MSVRESAGTKPFGLTLAAVNGKNRTDKERLQRLRVVMSTTMLLAGVEWCWYHHSTA